MVSINPAAARILAVDEATVVGETALGSIGGWSEIEDSARPLAGGIIATYADIVPTIPKKADVNQIVLKAIESALFGDNPVPAQQALTDAVKQANELIK